MMATRQLTLEEMRRVRTDPSRVTKRGRYTGADGHEDSREGLDSAAARTHVSLDSPGQQGSPRERSVSCFRGPMQRKPVKMHTRSCYAGLSGVEKPTGAETPPVGLANHRCCCHSVSRSVD